ncbi:MAG TPA: VOC family protein [Dehalococcoidia bacterium]|jgi:catechol 2,3-dioxygenase-like lactoylglutathione lyase family enzyme
MPLTTRISHPGLTGTKREETIRFYTDLLGMEIVLRQPNLDFPAEEHLFFHAGNDTFIAYFLPVEGADLSIYAASRKGNGGMDHLAFDIEAGAFAQVRARLQGAGVPFEGPIDRGYERSIYFSDPNGVTIELLTWITPPPAGAPLAPIIARAQQLRARRGAALIEDVDVRSAIAELHGVRA